MTRTTRKLRELAASFDLCAPDAEVELQRTRAGRHQRAAGAWSWELIERRDGGGSRHVCGSQWPAWKLLKANGVIMQPTPWGDKELFPAWESKLP